MLDIPDDQKLDVVFGNDNEVRDRVRAMHKDNDYFYRATLVDAGTYYGAFRERGIGHDEARDLIRGMVNAWVEKRDPDYPPIKHVGDEEKLMLAREAQVISTDDPGGLFDLGCQYGQRIQEGRRKERAFHETGEWLQRYYGGQNPWTQVIDPVHGGLRGRLRKSAGDQSFQDETGDVNPVLCHAGDLFAVYVRNKARAEAEVNKVARGGYHGIRFWTCLGGDWWQSKDRHVNDYQTPNFWGLMREFIQLLSTNGLVAAVSQGDIANMPNREGFMRNLGRAFQEVSPTTAAFIDGGNEAWQTGEKEPDKLRRLVDWFREECPGAIATLTSPYDENVHDEGGNYGLNTYSVDIYDVHGFRGGHYWDKIRHIFSIPYEGKPARRLGIQSEHTGPGDMVSVTSNKHELDAETMALFGAMSIMARQAYIYFCGDGVVLRDSLESSPGFYSTPRMVHLMPKGVMRYQTLCHSGESWRHKRIFRIPSDAHELRIDNAISDSGEFATMFYGPGGHFNVPVERGFTGTLLSPETGEGQEISLEAGQHLDLNFNRGRVLIGTHR